MNPHLHEAERAAIGAVLVDPSSADVVLELAAEDFASARCGEIRDAIARVVGTDAVPDLRTVGAELEAAGSNVTIAELAGLETSLPDVERVGDYVVAVRRAAQKRKVTTAAQKLVEDPDDERARAELEEVLATPCEAISLARTAAEIVTEGVDLPSPVLNKLAWPGRVTLLVAPAKLGKSTLSTYGAACVSTSSEFLGSVAKRGPVLIASEEYPADLARRLRDMNADLEVVSVLQWRSDPTAEIRAAAADTDPILIIVDSLADVAQHIAPESGSSTQWSRVVRPLVRLARETGAALLILHHARKSDGTSRDSGEIEAAVDVIATMRAGSGTRRKIEYRGRYGRGEFTVRLVGNRFELDSDERGTDEISGDIVSHVSANDGCSQRSILDAVSSRAATVRQALTNLIADGRITEGGSPARRRYSAPKSVSRPNTRDTVRETVSDASVSTVSDQREIEDSRSGKRSGTHSVSRIARHKSRTGHGSPDHPKAKGAG